MINISIAGIGGQGSVLAAKILAQAAQAKGWQVRTTETKGMAQRGGSVVSHIRMGNAGEVVYAPLPAKGSVDVLIALEPGEGARALPLLKAGGLLVVPVSGVAPIALETKNTSYKPKILIDELKEKGISVVVVDDLDICARLNSRKSLNIIMLVYALLAANKRSDCENNALRGNLSLDEVREAIKVCVKSDFVKMNMKAIDMTEKVYSND